MINHDGRQHAKYSASTSERWFGCAGSVAASAAVPERPASGYAMDGTEAHELVEWALRARERSALLAFMASDMKWTHRYDDETVRIESVQVMLDYVYDLVDAYEDAVLVLEHQFVFPSLVTDDAGGTNDVIVIVPSLGLVYVIDFKHGAGHAVEVEENKQLLTYAVGAVSSFNTTEAFGYDVCDITLVVVQPRAFHPNGGVREWPVPRGRLEMFIDEFDQKVLACEQPNAPLVPGDYCRWCPAAPTCKALEDRAMMATSVNFAMVKQVKLPDPRELPVDRLAAILDSADILEAWLKQAYDYALELTNAGYTVPGWKLVEGLTHRKFIAAPEETAEKLMALTGVKLDDVMPRKLITMTAAEKLVKDVFKQHGTDKKKQVELANKAFAELTDKEPSDTLTLVPVADRRQAVNRAANFKTVALPAPNSA